MGKHGVEYARVARDLYPTPAWITEELLRHFDLTKTTVWEPAAGKGDMVSYLRDSGVWVVATDIADYGFPLAAVMDFTNGQLPPAPFQAIVTNPPGGLGNRLAEKFICTGLRHLDHGAHLLALLLSTDFDSAKTRSVFFADCPTFMAKIVLRERAVWFERNDGVREAPRENHAWYVWQRTLLKTRTPPILLYGPELPVERLAP